MKGRIFSPLFDPSKLPLHLYKFSYAIKVQLTITIHTTLFYLHVVGVNRVIIDYQYDRVLKQYKNINADQLLQR